MSIIKDKKKIFRLVSFVISIVAVLTIVFSVKKFGLGAFFNDEIKIYQEKAPTEQSDGFRINSIRLGDKLVDVNDLNIVGWKKSNTLTGYPLYTDGYETGNMITFKVSPKFMFNNPVINWQLGPENWRAFVSYQDTKVMQLNAYAEVENNSSVSINYPSFISVLLQYSMMILAILGLSYLLNKVFNSFYDTNENKLKIKEGFIFIAKQIPKILILGLTYFAFSLIFDSRIPDSPLYLLGASMKKNDMFAVISLVAIFAIGFNYYLKKNERISYIYGLCLYFVNPLVVFLICEFAYNPDVWDMSILYILLNAFIILLLQTFIFLITRSWKISTISVLVTLLAFGMANDVLMELRDSPLIPAFLGMLGVATDVAGETVISFSGKSLAAAAYAFMWMFILFSQPHIKAKLTLKKYFIPLISYSALMFAVIMASSTYLIEHSRVGVNLWRPSRTYYVEGSPYSFYRLAVNQMLRAPENYSKGNVEKILEKYNKEDENAVKSDKKPNIIMIQSEAEADYNEIGNLQLNKNPLSFQLGLKDNAIQGKLHVSVLGGGTVNTEYEALTGNSLTFFPDGSYPFQQYVDEGANSIGRLLENQGYDTYITHPNKSTNYSRQEVWKNLGFNDIDFLESYNGDKEENTSEYLKSQSDEYAHGHVSDKFLFEKLIEKYKNKGDKPLFSYLVTMQNHGGYPGSETGNIDIVGHEGENNGANEYLNLLSESDKAFEELVNYFKNSDEPTIICIYGDHQPQNYKYFMDLAYGEGNYGNYETHWTPLTIWANYTIPEVKDLEISANYLSAFLFKVAGLGLRTSAYQNYQLDMMQKYPIMTRYNNKDTTFTEVTENSDFIKKKQELDSIIYYNVKDPDRNNKYFINPAEK
ncbi:MAG: sulfatase-like hydrolase/transferase [Peptoniphilaceae bacterium]|nr:sulfatase-like hydrolase/transferase [Peptoniphilaceae bacterium]MDY3737949.1 sulfatase-like hydrolase/transferase [Peptoniphilaceae bacterium]